MKTFPMFTRLTNYHTSLCPFRMLHTASIIFLVLLCIPACAPPPKYPVEPGRLFKGSYINIKAPNTSDWFLVSSNNSGMGFAKSGGNEQESFIAQVNMFGFPPTKTADEFMDLVKKSYAVDKRPNRYFEIKSEFDFSYDRKYPCALAYSVVEDREAKTSSNGLEKLLMQSKTLFCRHPVRQDTGFEVVFSFRGHELYPHFEFEANDFINGIQVTDF